ncbi:hypothetical protein JOL79_21985 [Microbispora sp. RL4-1S]|uniref:Uncharacterized protein n=1 Tax=Microbispora oryzae TaxID=2806554 RepID=A0A941AKU5_9ACTN|nr:hypothetical protein [Microbispora oryzae]MBP2706482.1 hypothetical protein [Microbispora oryzae]
MNERNSDTGRLDGATEGVVDEPAITQGDPGDTAGTTTEDQAPGHTQDATDPPLPPPRSETARSAGRVVGEDEIVESRRDIAPGGTIETALTPSGTASMVASQLLWDGSSATSRIDESIAAAMADDEDAPEEDAGREDERPG